VGLHPWQADEPDAAARLAALPNALAADSSLGVGEIGLDRLRSRRVSDGQRQALAQQLELAAAFRRPVVLHGAKCWGEVVKACLPYRGRIPAFLFHGFSRSTGLLPDIVSLNGFISVGPALLNDHAVNYREMAALLPPDRLLVETDLSDDDPAADRAGVLTSVYSALAALRGHTLLELQSQLAANAVRLCAHLGY
jgi:TatD DNase family protein